MRKTLMGIVCSPLPKVTGNFEIKVHEHYRVALTIVVVPPTKPSESSETQGFQTSNPLCPTKWFVWLFMIS
ncbi:hypothetical protein EPI10_011507 [Gossypium australe]|uniref:Uncharacterized protein n=1 Tax=Gossypium australe TaxID=47621 RepID=A0A5B6W6X4_9ROSI|nr:hypothetical protein EPI10_011507 [Gossypium australe]